MEWKHLKQCASFSQAVGNNQKMMSDVSSLLAVSIFPCHTVVLIFSGPKQKFNLSLCFGNFFLFLLVSFGMAAAVHIEDILNGFFGAFCSNHNLIHLQLTKLHSCIGQSCCCFHPCCHHHNMPEHEFFERTRCEDHFACRCASHIRLPRRL